MQQYYQAQQKNVEKYFGGLDMRRWGVGLGGATLILTEIKSMVIGIMNCIWIETNLIFQTVKRFY